MDIIMKALEMIAEEENRNRLESRKIISAEIAKKGRYQNVLLATLEDGEEVEVFCFFPDELRFSASEFVGRTLRNAKDAYYEADVAYLRS